MLINGKDITVQANGITICYDDLGVGRVPLLFIHGFPFDRTMWQPQLDFLKSTQRVITYDIRGFGKSTTNDENASMTLFADDLIKMLDTLQINKVVACGLSMGGYILLDAVSRYPERFEAIILSDTQCIADSPEAKEKRFKTIELIENGGLNNWADGFIKNLFSKETLESKKELVEKIRSIMLSTSTETIIATLKALAYRNERCAELSDIAIPALILCGKEDVVTPIAQSEMMLDMIETSVMITIDGAGHLSNMEQPDKFNEQVNNFLSGFLK
jgi:pimeloyl-ACP methyl ester carboxylesterase